MKYCPQCQTTYSDDLLKYCLKDGAPLGEVFGSQTPNAASGGEKTVPSIRQVEPIRVPVETSAAVQNPPARNTPPNASPINAMQPEPTRTKTGFIVAMTILATLLLLGLGGVGALFYFRNQKPEVAANINKSPVNRAVNTNSANLLTGNQNSNQNTNANITIASPAVTPKTALNRQQADEIADEVKDAIDEWKNATENLDIGGQLSQYAETVDYYTSGRVNRTRVRADKDRAFGIYKSVNIDISNVKITPGDSGENATALFDKKWDFRGDASDSSGKVQQQLTFSKIDGRWLITGERDLRVYYINN